MSGSVSSEQTISVITESSSTPASTMEIITEIRPADILFGRGRPFQTHHGNRCLHKIVDKYKGQYQRSRRNTKRKITLAIVQYIQVQCQGCFLKQHESKKNAWTLASPSEALEKVRHTMRTRLNSDVEEEIKIDLDGPLGMSEQKPKEKGSVVLDSVAVVPPLSVAKPVVHRSSNVTILQQQQVKQKIQQMQLMQQHHNLHHYQQQQHPFQQQQMQRQEQQQQCKKAPASPSFFTQNFTPTIAKRATKSKVKTGKRTPSPIISAAAPLKQQQTNVFCKSNIIPQTANSFSSNDNDMRIGMNSVSMQSSLSPESRNSLPIMAPIPTRMRTPPLISGFDALGVDRMPSPFGLGMGPNFGNSSMAAELIRQNQHQYMMMDFIMATETSPSPPPLPPAPSSVMFMSFEERALRARLAELQRARETTAATAAMTMARKSSGMRDFFLK